MKATLAFWSKPTAYAYVQNFILIGLFGFHLAEKKQFYLFWTSAFCAVASWQHTEKVEHGSK